MNARIEWPEEVNEVEVMTGEPAELPDAEEPEQDVPLGVEAEEPTIADDIKKDDETQNEEPSSIIEPEASDEDEDEDDDDDEDESEDLDEDEDEVDDEDEEPLDEDDEEDEELPTEREESIDLK